jgi:hypothetical protein
MLESGALIVSHNQLQAHFSEANFVRTLALATLWFVLSAGPSLAMCPALACGPQHFGAPAPLIGLGIESAVAVGAVLLGSKLFKRWRK